ncbi:MMPL family transporter [Arthrobacter sp. AOP36-C1-22]|uniref:MMPL family transporter n=1 Tax=Arthrobacter sp. AOP36-C1-22 TaxID=3457683 RepID=UPI0040334AF0
MATFLYKLGRMAYRRRWAVISAWLVGLLAIGLSASAFMGTLTNSFSIPGTETQTALDKLKKEMPEFSGGSGSIVYQTSDGKNFTTAQKKAVASSLDELEALTDVREASNPFTTQKELDDAQQKLDDSKKELTDGEDQLKDGREQLADGKDQIADAKKEIADGRQKLETEQAKIDDGRAELKDAKAELDGAAQAGAIPPQQLAANRAKLEATQKQLDQGQAKIDATTEQLDAAEQQLSSKESKVSASEKKLEESAKELEQGKKDLALGKRQAESTEGMRFVSKDGTTVAVNVTFTGSADALTPDVRDEIKDIAGEATSTGLDVDYSTEIVQDISSIFGSAEIIGLVIAAVVLLVMLGTFVAAGLPLLMAVLGVGAGVGGTLALSSAIEMASITPALALMLGLAVGIDYSLFIVHRHRRQLLDGMEIEESIGRATGTSGNAVVFAGLTVIIALSALAVPALPFLSVLGLSAAFTVAMAVLIAITLTPALLGIIGPKLVSKRAWRKAAAATAPEATPASEGTDSAAHPNAAGNRGWGAFVTKRPVLMSVVGVLLLGIMAVPALQLRTALPDGSAEPVDSSAHQAYDLLSDKFGAGYNGPIIALADLPAGLDADEAEAKNLDIADQLRGINGVVAAVPVGINDANTLAVLQIVPQEGPADPATEQVVTDIRNASTAIEAETDSHLALTGQVTAQIDVSERLAEVLPLYLGIVVGLSLVLLLLVFRSVIVPVLATGGFLLSLLASFGATVAVYQWGWLSGVFGVATPGPIMSFLPILLIGILFGLAMDYQVFLVSGMRESFVHGQRPRAAVRSGFAHSAPVVTSAALIMTSVFAGFIFSELTMIRAIGFALAIGVLLDAFVVRMTITPAIMHLLGRRAWYIPKWLDKVLPDVDVEGAKIAALATPGTAGGSSDTSDSGPDSDGPHGGDHDGHEEPGAGGSRHPAHRADGPDDALR